MQGHSDRKNIMLDANSLLYKYILQNSYYGWLCAV